MSGIPRPVALHKLQSKDGPSQVTAENALVKARILAAEFQEEIGHNFLLVWRAIKDIRETSSGEACRDFGEYTHRAADSGDKGTCETMATR